MSITSVRFPARYFDDMARETTRITHFKLGLGPCGKVVESIDVDAGFNTLTIVQNCTDGERKIFVYPLHTIMGRVEILEG